VNISPLDIRKHEFKKSIRGFDVDEVMAFLDLVSMDFENLIRDNSQLKDRTASLDSQLKKYHDIESTLRETLLSAQRAREDTITTAKKQADVIIREAEVKASSISDEGRRDLDHLRRVITELRMLKDNYVIKLKSLVNTQLEMVEHLDFTSDELSSKMDAVYEPPEPKQKKSELFRVDLNKNAPTEPKQSSRGKKDREDRQDGLQ